MGTEAQENVLLWLLLVHLSLTQGSHVSCQHQGNCWDNSLDCEQRKISDSTRVLAEVQFRSVQSSVLSDSLWPHGLEHARLPCLSPTPGACSNSHPSNRWCHPIISTSVILCYPLLLLPSIFSSIRVFPRSNILAEVINPLDNLEKILLFPPCYNLKTKN